VGITSFDKALYMGVMCDPNLIADVEKIGEYIADEFRFLREAAGVQVDDLPQIGARTKRNGANGAKPRSETPASTPISQPAVAAPPAG
jgi:hypothetical protein